MGEHKLQLAIPKTQIIFLTRRSVPAITDITIDDGENPHTILTKSFVEFCLIKQAELSETIPKVV